MSIKPIRRQNIIEMNKSVNCCKHLNKEIIDKGDNNTNTFMTIEINFRILRKCLCGAKSCLIRSGGTVAKPISGNVVSNINCGSIARLIIKRARES